MNTHKQQRASDRAAFADHVYNASEPVQLSKWWQTPSCQAAYERAALKRAERIQKLTADLAQRKAALDSQIWKE